LARKKDPVSGKVVALSTIFLIMLVLAIVATINVGIQNGWTIPGIGSIGFGTGTTNSTGSGTVTTTGNSGSGYITCTATSCPSGSILPAGQVKFNMQLLAVYPDGTNSTISNQQGIPNLAQISFNGRPLDHVDAQAVIGYVSSLPLPPGSTATYIVNETALNSKTNYEVWHSFNYETGFINNNTLSLFLLPDFNLPAVQVYSDVCNNNSTGGVTCNLPANTPQSRQVTWNVVASVTITAPANFAVLPFTVSNIAVSAANFNAENIVGCTNCGTSATPSVTATLNTNSASINSNANANKGNNSPPIGCANCNPGTSSSAPAQVTSQEEGNYVIERQTGSDGKTNLGQGTTTGGGKVTSKTEGESVAERPQASLLPVNYVPLSFGSFEVVNPWALVFFTIIWVAVAAGIAAIIVLARNSGKRKRKR
jgi:hypothetical protein